MRLNREELLRKLEAVSPGLAVKEAVEQSSCFAFRDGRVVTFNDEIACSMECVAGFEGAVAAKPLLELLNKMVETEVDVSIGGAELLVKGKRRRAGITLETNITLPVGVVEPPTEWVDIDPEFSEAVNVVQHCASSDSNQFHLTCLHITPEFVEACDNFQVARYPVHTGLAAPCLAKRDSLRHIVGLGMTEVSETKAWLHFRNPAGLVFSVRREVHDFEDLARILDVNGITTTLPGGLAEAVEKAQIFSSENAENNVVIVELRVGQLRLRGIGASGWYEERKNVQWGGEPLSFTMAPKLLLEIVSRTNDCVIAPGRLKIDGGKFIYVTCLGKVD